MRRSTWPTMARHGMLATGLLVISRSTTPSGRIRRSTTVAPPISILGRTGGRGQPRFFGTGGAQRPRPGSLRPARALSPGVKRFIRVTEAPTRKTGAKVVLDIGSTLDRQYYEFAVLHELRNHLRAGDVWVTGSRQFREFDDYLILPAAWAAQKQTDEWTLAVPRTFSEYLDQQRTLLHEQLTIVNDQLAAKTLPDVTLRNGKLRLTRLEKAVPD